MCNESKNKYPAATAAATGGDVIMRDIRILFGYIWWLRQ